MKEPKGHRAALLTARDHRQIIRLIQKGEGRTLKEIQSKLSQKVSIATLSRAVQQNPEIIRQAPYAHPGLTAGYREQRVVWAKERLANLVDWTQVIYIDETQLECDGDSKPYKELTTTRRPRRGVRKRVHGGGVINLWVAIRPGNFFEYSLIKGSMTADTYARLMDSKIVGHGMLVMQDNLRLHNSPLVQDVLTAQHIKNVQQPPLSPDLQPIENIFSIIKRKLYQGNRSYNTPTQLYMAFCSTVADMKHNGEFAILYQKLSLSMPSRLQQVIESGGHKISY